MSSTKSESVADNDVTPSQSQAPPSTTVAVSTANVVDESLNQVSFFTDKLLFLLFYLSFATNFYS